MPNLNTFAKTIVEYSCSVKSGENVLILAEGRVEDLGDGHVAEVQGRKRLAIGAQRLVGARRAEYILDPQGLSAQQVGHQGHAVAIARNHVQDRLHAFASHQRRGGQSRHAHVIAIVADPRGVNLAFQPPGDVAHGARVGPLRRTQLGHQERFSRINTLLQYGCRCAHEPDSLPARKDTASAFARVIAG